jgi:hypothetical protein
VHDRDPKQHEAASSYEPPRLDELGHVAEATKAEGSHVGKVVGGSDAFLMVGRGAVATTSV